MATRLATFAIVPVKRLWIALKPVSNGEPCAIAATGMTRSRTRTVVVVGANFDRRRSWIGRMKRDRKKRDMCTSYGTFIRLPFAQTNLTPSTSPTPFRRPVVLEKSAYED